MLDTQNAENLTPPSDRSCRGFPICRINRSALMPFSHLPQDFLLPSKTQHIFMKYYTAEQVAEVFALSSKTLRKLINTEKTEQSR